MIMEAEIRHRIRPTYGKDKVEIVTDEDCEIVIENGKCFIVRKSNEYPKTCEECCRIVNANPCIRLIYDLSDGQKYSYDVDNLQHYENIRKLLICRDAYWKIAGEQMGLGKPWKPDYVEGVVNTYYTIHTFNNKLFCAGTSHRNAILSFPTEEMRDAFYENFKKLIELVKELL